MTSPASAPEDAHRIPRLSSPSPQEFFSSYYRPARPVILTGALRSWPCFQRWTVEHLRQTLGPLQHTFHYEDDRTLQMSVADYLDLAFGEPGHRAFPVVPSATEKIPYMRHFGPLEGPMEGEYPLASLFPATDDLRLLSYLFCGVASTKTNCHYDWSHNFVGVLRGRKHVTLLPPGAEKDMAIDDLFKRKMARGNCDYFEDPPSLRLGAGPRAPGELAMHEHPVFRGCPEVYYDVLEPGDLVFFPAYWYHYFHNLEPTITVTTQSRIIDLPPEAPAGLSPA